MSFKQISTDQQQIELLQRSLERGRLAHAYLLEGENLKELEDIARTLAKTLNCEEPVRASAGATPVDSCDECLPCRKTDHRSHPDVQWLQPESKSRVITVAEMRDLLRTVHLKPTEARWKVAVISSADRLNPQAANAFLKTLEEPPERTVMLLLTTEPQRILETIQSRCLRLSFRTGAAPVLTTEELEWLTQFSQSAASEQQSLMGRYRLLGMLLARLATLKSSVQESVEASSPLQEYEEADKALRDRWEDQLNASVEAEYRRQRASLLQVLQHWLRDTWIAAQQLDAKLMMFPELSATRDVGERITPDDAMENLQIIEQTQRLLHTNVQEALALEVSLLKLHF